VAMQLGNGTYCLFQMHIDSPAVLRIRRMNLDYLLRGAGDKAERHFGGLSRAHRKDSARSSRAIVSDLEGWDGAPSA